MKQITFAQKLRYRFDNTMSKGAAALIGWLFLVSLVMIVLFSAVVVLSGAAPAGEGGEQPGFLSLLWSTLMHALDAGTVAGDTGERSYLAMMFGVTLGGIFIVSILIGLLTSGIENKLSDLRKGRSFVVEEGHTLILGWSAQIFSILEELILANESRSGAAIVILAEKDKVDMEDEIRSKIGDSRRTRIVCRTGSPIDLGDLAIVNPGAARSIIVLSPENDDPDSHVIKTLLALVHSPERPEKPYHIVAEIRDRANMEVARLVAKDEAQLLLVGDLISRITVQTCRQSGLSVVYNELLDFGGDEIYMREEPELAGKAFKDALFAYEQSSPIGLLKKDGTIALSPAPDTVIAKGDRVIVIAADDSAIAMSKGKKAEISEKAIRTKKTAKREAENTLILGWNHRGVAMILELDKYVSSGSVVSVVASDEGVKQVIADECPELSNIRIQFVLGDTTDRRVLDKITGEASYPHIITLSYSDTLETQAADARTLVTLLHLRDIAAKTGKTFSIVSEMLDIRNQKLAEVTRADDFIVSDKLISLMLSQISENKELAAVFADLFDPEGVELYLKPAGDYVALDEALTFYTVVESARRRGEVAIGYRRQALSGDSSASYGVKVNPKKSDKVRFEEGDRIIVLAEG